MVISNVFINFALSEFIHTLKVSKMETIELTIKIDEFANYLNFIVNTCKEEDARERIFAYQVIFSNEQWHAICKKAEELKNRITH